MGCINVKFDNLNIFNCEFSIGGVKRVFIAQYTSDFYTKIRVFNNVVVSVDSSIVFTELSFNNTGTKFTDSYNYDTKKYEQNFLMELVKMDYNKRTAIDSLVKAKIVIIFQDKNGKYYLIGERNGLNSNSYTGTTDVFNNKSNYIFNFFGKADYQPLGIDPQIVEDLSTVDCTILNSQLALTSTLYWSPYSECLVGNLPGFINP